ncbi:tRNA (N6-threonylcarbamoyladenosine(37)-N6)-methyltransferase TrmO [Chloroflexota bacterium]
MPSKTPDMPLVPVGTVANQVLEIPPPGFGWRGIVSTVHINPEYAGYLAGLDGFSHIIVLYWLHNSGERFNLPDMVHPRGDKNTPQTGRFATRSPHRPNPIGLSVGKIIEIHNTVITVQGLDAINGSPVLDIKPYIPGSDSIPGAAVPGWV